MLSPSSCRADQTVGHQAETEIEDHAEVELEWMVASHRGKRWDQSKVHQVPEHDRQQRLEEVCPHYWF